MTSVKLVSGLMMSNQARDGTDPNSQDDTNEQECIALYDYEYTNKYGEVIKIIENERYILLDKTNKEWWHVRSRLTYHNFYVPAQYMRVCESTNPNPQSLHRTHSNEGNETPPTKPNTGIEASPSPDYTSDNNRTPPPDYSDGFELSPMPTFAQRDKLYRRSYSVDQADEYANIDMIRAAQHGFTREVSEVEDDPGGDYANLAMIQSNLQANLQPPKPQPKNFIRAVSDTWQLYQDPTSRRYYYFNSLTLELTWKPPRIDQSELPTGDNEVAMANGSGIDDYDYVPSARPIATPVADPRVPPIHIPELTHPDDAPSPDGWSEDKNEDGVVVFTNDTTDEKWLSSYDGETGRQYFYQEGSDRSTWTLPPVSMSASLQVESRPESVASRIDRFSKSKSMYINSSKSVDTPKVSDSVIPKTHTLPPGLKSFNASKDNNSDPTKPSPTSNFVTTQVFLQGPKDGYLNKAKVLEGGKKVKKNWSQSYVLLTGSNLVFYKDQKSSQPRSGSPHGRPEFIVSLHGGRVQFDPRDKSSKKNVIMLTNSGNSQFLLQNDDFFKIHNWYIALSETIQMLNHGLEIPTIVNEQQQSSTETSPPMNNNATAPSKPQNKSSIDRSGSMADTKIRSRLRQLISRRPTADNLKARGIYKDAVFGADLKQLCERDHATVPKFVKNCIATIEHRGLDMDGLYRLSGNVSQIQKLRHMIDQDQWQALSDPIWDLNVLTGTLKLFFRELKEPLFPFECYNKFVAAVQLMPSSTRLKAFRDLLSHLPKPNHDTIKYLFSHLNRVTQHSKSNRMEPHNIAIVFGPTLLWPQTRSSHTMAVSMVYQNRIIECILTDFDNVFK